ncbi:PAS-domain containing protein [Terasakiella pusilla]|uniref:PAS-domain containing protein n=1 Tax=Terasakiella pusilla TaxID=64973 RepID=UPI003AA879B3
MTNAPLHSLSLQNSPFLVQALDSLDQGICIFDKDLTLAYVNQTFRDLYDYPPDLVQPGLAFAALVEYNIDREEYGPGDKAARLQERLDDARNIKARTFLRKRPNGQVLSITDTPLAEGGFMSTYRDVTEAHQAKVDLQDKDQEFKSFLELSPVGAMLVNMDGTLRFINSRMIEMFGYDKDDMQSIHTTDFYFDINDRSFFIKTLKAANTTSTFHFWGKRKDGSAFPVLVTSRIIKLKEKERIFSWVHDLTKLRKAEAQIEKLSRHNELILSSAGAGILEVNEDNLIEYINPAAARLLGFDATELVQTPFSDLMLDKTDALDLLHSTKASGETEMVTKSGLPLPVKYNVNNIEDNTGRNHKVIVFDDITDRVAAEAALHQAINDIEKTSRAKSRFLSIMSHELRTPLNAILGFAQILKQNRTDNLNDQQLTFIDHMFKAGDHLLKLVNEAIDISAIENGQITLSLQTIDLRDIIDNCIQLTQSHADEKNISITFETTSETPLYIIVDHARLQQIVLHLLSNAVKYNKDNGRVFILCEEAPHQRARLRVRDTGRGISQSEGKRVFEPFNRLSVHTEGIEGTGLGLTLSKHLCDLMGGEIGFSSIEDEGSEFWIEFPLTDESTPLLVPSLNRRKS